MKSWADTIIGNLSENKDRKSAIRSHLLRNSVNYDKTDFASMIQTKWRKIACFCSTRQFLLHKNCHVEQFSD